MVYLNSGGSKVPAEDVNFEEPTQAAPADDSKSGSPSAPSPSQ